MAFPWSRKPDEITSFSRIFHLLPRLEVMHLRNLEGSPGSTLPLGPAPRTLREVSLQGWACDLFALYTAWALESVANVQLTKEVEERFDVGPFISGAIEISVVHNRSPCPEMRTLALLPDGRQRTFVWSNVPKSRDAIDKIADAIRDTPVLAHMHALDVPLSILCRALANASQWPSLARLTVHFHDHEHEIDNLLFTRGADDGVRFLWARLDYLRAVPALERLTLHVHTWHDAKPPTAQEAQDLRTRLCTIGDCIPGEVLVHGFPAQAVRAVSLQDGSRPHVVFVSSNSC